MKIIRRLFINNKIKYLLDTLVTTNDYPKSFGKERGNEKIISKVLEKGYVEEYMQSSGITIGDRNFQHEAYRLTKKGKSIAQSYQEKEALLRFKSGATGWIVSVCGAVLAGFILFHIGIR